MSNVNKIIIAVVGVVVIVGVVWLLTSNKTAESPSTPTTSQGSEKSNETTATVTFTYTDAGFSPSTATVKAGQTIKVTNNSPLTPTQLIQITQN
jgi:plastocyanin